jgi:glycosyltransferase involved in cell wall biosynthesis
MVTGTSARLGSLDPLYVLYLPKLSSSITFRAYLPERNGQSLLDRCLERLTAGKPHEDVVAVYHDEVDGCALLPWKRKGVFVWRSNRESAVEALSEIPLSFPDRTIAVCNVEIVFAPDDLIDRALEHHAATRNHYTCVEGIPPEACPEVFEPAVLGILFRHRFASDVTPGQVLQELATMRQNASEADRVRAAPLNVASLYDPADMPVSVRLKTAYETQAGYAALQANPKGFHRLSAFQPPPDSRVFPAFPLPAKLGRPRMLYFSPSCGFSGAEQSLVQVVRQIGDEFDQVAVVGFEGVFEQKLKEGGCHTYAPNVDLREPVPSARQLARDILEWADPDVVHSNGDPGMPMLEALRNVGLPLVQHVRIIEVEALMEPMRQASSVIAISRYTRAAIERLGMDPAKITTIYNSVDTREFHRDCFDKAEMRKAFGIPPDAVCSLMIARPEPSKRHDLFIQAAAKTLLRSPNAWFALAGEGGDRPMEHQIRTLVDQHGLSSRLTSAGFVPDIRRILAASDILVLPADGEPLGRCVLEAMAMGLPAIVTDNGGSCELVEHDKTGYIVQNGNAEALAQALSALLTNEDLRAEYGAAGRRAAEARFDARDCARSLSAIFKSVAALQ